MSIDDTFEQYLSSLESTLGIYNDPFEEEEDENMNVRMRPPQIRPSHSTTTLQASGSPRPSPPRTRSRLYTRLASSPIGRQSPGGRSSSSFKHLDAVTTLGLRGFGVGSGGPGNVENGNLRNVSDQDEKMSDSKQPLISHSDLPQSQPLSPPQQRQPPEVMEEDASVANHSYASSSNTSHEESVRRLLRLANDEKNQMKHAMTSLAKATKHQTNRHYTYKRKYIQSKKQLEESEEKVAQTLTEKENFKTSFFKVRADYMMEKDIREELSDEVQMLAREMNELRREREAGEELKLLLVEQLDDEYNEHDLSYDDGHDPVPIVQTQSSSPQKELDRLQTEFQEYEPESSSQSIQHDSTAPKRRVRFADQIEHTARVAEILNSPRNDDIAASPNFIESMTPDEVLSNSVEYVETASYEAMKLSLELEILNLKTIMSHKDERIQMLEDRVAYLEGKLQIVKSFLLGDIQNDISSLGSFDELHDILENSNEGLEEHGTVDVIEEGDEEGDEEMY